MREFKSFQDYWHFQSTVKKKNRFVRDPDTEEFLCAVRETATQHIEVISAESIVYRAQRGNGWRPVLQEDQIIDEVPIAYPSQRMKPDNEHAVENRANPKGIPYLYVATNKLTALAETRPWVGSFISGWIFKIRYPLRIVNLTNVSRPTRIYVGGEPPPQDRERWVWSDIDEAFAKPVTRDDDILDYVPTQIIAEVFRLAGYDGIAYRSSVGPGHNLALFDLNSADPVTSFGLFQVEATFEEDSVKFRFEGQPP